MNRLLSIFCAIGLLFATPTHAFTIKPIDGLWSLDAELGLAIGRAFNFELTSNLLVMTMYTYNAQRAPTFYVGAGVLDSANRVVATLSEPQGGTCLGCTPTSGSLLSTPGQTTLEFTTSTTGFITLPGELRKPMRKGPIAWPAAPAGLFGLWNFSYLTLVGGAYVATTDVLSFSRTVTGTSTDNGIVVDAIGTTGCAHKTSGSLAGFVLCTKLTSAGALDKTVITTWWGDQVDGQWQPANTTLVNPFNGKRLVSPNGDNVGIKNEPGLSAARADAMRAAMIRAEAEFTR